MKTTLPKNAEEIAAAAPLAASGVLGADFWNEVTERLNENGPEPVTVEPRPVTIKHGN